MAKNPTSWVTNPSKEQSTLTYNDSNTQYSSSTAVYVDSTVNLDQFNKPATAWTVTAKIASGWVTNPNFETNSYAYDGTNAYDTTKTYDGVNSGQSSISTKPLTSWSQL